MEWNGDIEVDLRMAVIWYFLSKKLQTEPTHARMVTTVQNSLIICAY